MSDLHLEFGELDVAVGEDEQNTTLVLAGDIGIAHQPDVYVGFFTKMSNRFKHIIYIMGNHEHYRGKFPLTLSILQDKLKSLSNVSVVDKDTVIVDGVAFVCATLWTDFDGGNPMSMWYAKTGMNDFKLIRTGPKSEPWRRKFGPEDAFVDFTHAKDFIFKEIPKQKEMGNSVMVVTHHAPSHESSAPEWRNADTAGAYASVLVDEILAAEPDVWVHGHMHSTSDYMIGNTRILANPFGYMKHDVNGEFNDLLTVEL